VGDFISETLRQFEAGPPATREAALATARQTLGVERTANADQLTERYREHCEDLAYADGAKKFEDVTRAYIVLTNELVG
jgi:hypothetical protein